jgi:hypothetical protein
MFQFKPRADLPTLIMETFVVAKKYQNGLLTTYDRASMPEK